MELPVQVKKKIKTTKTVYNKEIIVSNDEELNQILQGNDLFQEVPLPTKSTIQNLIKDSMILSSNETKTNNVNNISINNDNYGTKTRILNNNANIYKKNKKKEEIPEQKIIYKNKNYIETYFHDDEIPQPIVCEGNALQFSELKEPNESQEEKKSQSKESHSSHDNIENLLNSLPVEHTVLLSQQPKIDMSKVQKDNMLSKSLVSINSKNIKTNIINEYPSKENLFRSQVLNYNNKNINNKEIKKLNNSLTFPQKKKILYNNNINENPLPEMDINMSKDNNNNINYRTQIKTNHIQPLMKLNNKTINKNKTTINKESFPTKSSEGSFTSMTSMPENPF